MKKTANIFLLCFLLSVNLFSQTVVLQEDFTNYQGTSITVPSGWNFSYNGDYTTTGNCGTSGLNSYKFGVNNATINSPAFINADTIHFWAKGIGTDALSQLTVLESPDSVVWDTVGKIKPIPTSGTAFRFHVLNSSTHLRFVYTKSAGNLAFDDLLLTRNNSPANSSIKIYFNHPVNTSVATNQQAIYLNQLIDDTLIQYINRAKHTLDIAVYNYIQTSAISSIANAINNAYARGVRIRWIYNGSSSNSGLTLLNSNIPTLGSPTTSAYNIMHNKFMIVDAHSQNISDQIVWTGSTNWDDEQINTDVNNVVIVQDHNLAQAYTTEFNEMWGDTGMTPNTVNSKFGPFKTNNTPHNFTIGGISVESYFSPSDGTNSHIENAIHSADQQLFFGVYTFTDQGDADSIKNKILNQGVYCRGIMDPNSTSFAAYATLNPVMGSTLKIYNLSGLYHNKFLIADPCYTFSDPLVETGSHNWTASADQKNDENTLIIHDATIANLYYQSFFQNFTDLGGTITPCLMTDVYNSSNTTNDLSVFPIPASDKLTVSNLNGKYETLFIYDMTGKMIRTEKIISRDSQTIDVNNLSSGIYILHLSGKDNSFRKK